VQRAYKRSECSDRIMVASTKGLGPEKDCVGKTQQHIQKTPGLSSERSLHKNKTVTVK
jgi:hypothetical protein